MFRQWFVSDVELAHPALLNLGLTKALQSLHPGDKELEIALSVDRMIESMYLPVLADRQPNFDKLHCRGHVPLSLGIVRAVLRAAYQRQQYITFENGLLYSDHQLYEEIEKLLPALKQTGAVSLLIQIVGPFETWLYGCPVQPETGLPELKKLVSLRGVGDRQVEVVKHSLSYVLQQWLR